MNSALRTSRRSDGFRRCKFIRTRRCAKAGSRLQGNVECRRVALAVALRREQQLRPAVTEKSVVGVAQPAPSTGCVRLDGEHPLGESVVEIELRGEIDLAPGGV